MNGVNVMIITSFEVNSVRMEVKRIRMKKKLICFPFAFAAALEAK